MMTALGNKFAQNLGGPTTKYRIPLQSNLKKKMSQKIQSQKLSNDQGNKISMQSESKKSKSIRENV